MLSSGLSLFLCKIRIKVGAEIEAGEKALELRREKV